MVLVLCVLEFIFKEVPCLLMGKATVTSSASQSIYTGYFWPCSECFSFM